MSHDPLRVVFGAGQGKNQFYSTHDDDPANFPAGRCVALDSNGELTSQMRKTEDNFYLGVSLGESFPGSKKTKVLRSGSDVVLEVEPPRAIGGLLITDWEALLTGGGDSFQIDGVSFKAIPGEAIPGEATFQASVDNDTTSISLYTQINAHPVAKNKVIAVPYGPEAIIMGSWIGGPVGNLITLDFTDENNDGGAVLLYENGTFEGGSNDYSMLSGALGFIGQKPFVNPYTGRIDQNYLGYFGVGPINALLKSDVLAGIKEDGTEMPAVLLDFKGAF